MYEFQDASMFTYLGSAGGGGGRGAGGRGSRRA
eukprot:SAG22_NODE_6159_length_891_cov_1.577020_1_plen_32_part_01